MARANVRSLPSLGRGRCPRTPRIFTAKMMGIAGWLRQALGFGHGTGWEADDRPR